MTNFSWRLITIQFLLLFLPTLLISQVGKDADQAIPICALKSYTFDNTKDFGKEELQYYNLDCFSKSFKESNSHWMKMDVLEAGILTFFIAPHDQHADIDFVVFKNVGNDKLNLIPIRCMGSGIENKSLDVVQNRNSSKPCLGNTGLDINSLDAFEKTGCDYNDDNFLKYIRCRANDQLYIMINNHTNGKGFDIHFEGDVILKELPDCKVKSATSLLDAIELYPNPTLDVLQLKLELESQAVLDISILDFTGKKIMQFQKEGKLGLNRFNLPVKELPSGTYILSTKKEDDHVYKQFIKI